MNGQNSEAETTIYLTFAINGKDYAVKAKHIKEIKYFKDLEIKSIEAPKFIIGVTYFYNKITTILDIETLFFQQMLSEMNVAILFVDLKNSEDEFTGIAIKQLPNIIEPTVDEVFYESSKTNLCSITGFSKFIEGHIKIKDKIYYSLNIQKLLLENNLSNYRTFLATVKKNNDDHETNIG